MNPQRPQRHSRVAGIFRGLRWIAATWVAACLLVSLPSLAAASGTVAAWGRAANGPITPPESAYGRAVAIAAAAGHSLALMSDGSVVAWGSNNYGESNVPEVASHDVIAIAAGSTYSMAVTTSGRVVVWGQNVSGVADVPAAALSGVVRLAAGESHCLALRSDGYIVAWGSNQYGQTAFPGAAISGITRITRIAAGAYHSLAVTTKGAVVAWGDNRFGQIGSLAGALPASLASGVAEVAGGQYHSVFLKTDGTVVALGGNGHDEAVVPAAASTGVKAIACGMNHSLALKSDGSVVGWGASGNEQLVPSPFVPASGYSALAAGETFSLGLYTDPDPVLLLNAFPPAPCWAGRPFSFHAFAFGGTLQWQRNGVDVPGATNATFARSAAALEDAGSYTLIARGASRSVTSSLPTLLIVNWPKAPLIQSAPQSQTFPETFDVTLGGVVTGDDLSLQWIRDGTAISGASGSTLRLGPAQFSMQGDYALIATNAAGSVTSAPPARITVTPATVPQFTMTPESVTVVALSAQVLLKATIVADTLISAVWWKDGLNLPGRGTTVLESPGRYSSSLDLGTPGVGASGTYTLHLVTNAGDSVSPEVKVVVTPKAPLPPVIATPPAGTNAFLGDSIRFEVVATGRNLRYQWIKDGADLPGQAAASLTLTNVQPADAGDYRVRVSNDDGFVTSDPPARLVVSLRPVLQIVTQPVGTALTEGQPLRLNVVATGRSLRYQWMKNGKAVYGATNATYRLVRSLRLNAGEYTVAVSDGFSSATSAPPAVVTVSPPTNPVPAGGVVELEPALNLENSGGFYYDSSADISVPPEAQKGVVALSTFRDPVGTTNAPPGYDTPFQSGYNVHRLALLEDGRVVTWGYEFSINPFSLSHYFSTSYARVDASPENLEGVLGVQAGRSDYVLRANGSVSGFGPPDPADEGIALVAIAASPVSSALPKGNSPVAVESHLLALRNNGAVVELSGGGTAPAWVQAGVTAIAAGPQHSVALRDDGSVVAWAVPGGTGINVSPAMSSRVTGISADDTGFGAIKDDGTVVYQPLNGAIVQVPPQPGVDIKSGTPAFAITSDRRAVTWDGSRWAPAQVPDWTQGRILQRSGTCLLIASGPPVVTGTLPDQTVEEVKPFRLTAPGGGPGGTYQWLRNGGAIPGATNAVFVIPFVGSEDAGDYSVAIRNSLGSVESSPPARLTVKPPPETGMRVALTPTHGFEQALPAHFGRGIVQLAIGHLRSGVSYFLTLRYDGTVAGWIPDAYARPTSAIPAPYWFFSRYSAIFNAGQADVPEAAAHDAVEIDARNSESYVLRADGALFVWGVGTDYQFTRYTFAPGSVRRMKGGGGRFFINPQGGVVVRNGGSLSQDGIPGAARSGVVALAFQNASSACALRADGTVISLGTNAVPAALQPGIVAITAFGPTDFVAEVNDGTLIRWNPAGTVVPFTGGPFDDGLFAATGSDFSSRINYTRSGLLTTLAQSGVTIPDNWRGRVRDLGATGSPVLYYVAVLQTKPQVLEFPDIPARRLDAGPFTLAATASSGLPVSYFVVSGPAVVTGNVLTPTGAGTVVLQAVQLGDSTSESAVARQTVVISKASQVLNVPSVGSMAYGSGPIPLQASATSGLPVAFTVLDGPASIENGALRPTGIGVVHLAADQAGNADLEPAARFVQTVEVRPGLAVVTPQGGVPRPVTLRVFLPVGTTGVLEQCDVLGVWTRIASVQGSGPSTPALVNVTPPEGGASSRFWRVVGTN